MSDEKLRKRNWELQREIDRLTGQVQALQDVNGRLQVERALQEFRRLEETVVALQGRIRAMETSHAKQIQTLETELKRLDGRVTAAGRYVQDKFNGSESEAGP